MWCGCNNPIVCVFVKIEAGLKRMEVWKMGWKVGRGMEDWKRGWKGGRKEWKGGRKDGISSA